MEKGVPADNKYIQLCDYIKSFSKVAVAFSGGVDSTFLLAVARNVLGKENVAGITIDSPALPRYELEETIRLAKLIDAEHIIIVNNEIEDDIKNNPVDRCYHCKKVEFGSVIEKAREKNIEIVFDGSNADDLKDYRPGQKATKELQVKSPLVELNISKKEIREWSKILNLPTWDKPAYACLFSRIPYNSEIKIEDLRKIELSEKFLIDKGFKTIRVRCHNDLARIEVDRNNIQKLLEEPLASEIHKALKSFGFKFVTVDILGYRMGSFNDFFIQK